jgi:transcriptional regulator with XRE-family HTH domain
MARDLKPRTPVAERLVAARLHLRLGRDELAEALGWNRSTLAKYEQGASQPDFGFLDRLGAIFGISADWVITGRGAMRPADPGDGAEPAGSGLDERLLAVVVAGVLDVLGDGADRPAAPQVGRTVAAVYADLVTTYDSHAERLVGLKLALRNARRALSPLSDRDA